MRDAGQLSILRKQTICFLSQNTTSKCPEANERGRLLRILSTIHRTSRTSFNIWSPLGSSMVYRPTKPLPLLSRSSENACAMLGNTTLPVCRFTDRLSIHNPMVPSPPLKRHFLMPQILKTLIGTCYEWIIVWILVCMDTCTYMDMIWYGLLIWLSCGLLLWLLILGLY